MLSFSYLNTHSFSNLASWFVAGEVSPFSVCSVDDWPHGSLVKAWHSCHHLDLYHSRCRVTGLANIQLWLTCQPWAFCWQPLLASAVDELICDLSFVGLTRVVVTDCWLSFPLARDGCRPHWGSACPPPSSDSGGLPWPLTRGSPGPCQLSARTSDFQLRSMSHGSWGKLRS